MPRFGRFVGNSIRFFLENSLFLVTGAIAALIWANTDLESYTAVSQGAFHFVVNDVLMCFFFAIAGKEIWEAFLPGGALSSPRKAGTPLMATLGGVVFPAGLYVIGTTLFARPDLTRGWAIPCATDIAFSYLIARLLFGAKHPAIPFLLLLAIADDAIGLIILAVFYPTAELNPVLLLLCVAGAVAFNLALRRFGVTSFWAYLLVAGPLAWWGFYRGGVHPALALVPLIPTMPHAKRDAGLFVEGTMGESERPKDTLNQFEHWWKNPVELVLLCFGFANAGVAFSSVGLATGLVGAGLVIGKPLGITLFTLTAVKLFRLSMPAGMDFKDVVTLGAIAGIGFTVSLFVSTVAFTPGPPLDAAKMGALLSFGSAIVAVGLARLLGIRRQEPGPASIPPVAIQVSEPQRAS
jgi:Na+:H+ antiporter, NhaA family